MKEIILIGVILLFVIITITFIKSLKHFYLWYTNSIPPFKGIAGQSIEVFTMFSSKYLTKEGTENRDLFSKWLIISGVFMLCLIIIYTYLGINK